MKITVDTNVLLQVFVADDATQTRIATDTLEKAELVAIGLQALCEFAWVSSRRYGMTRTGIAAVIQRLLETRHVSLDRPAVEAGLAVLAGGGDFADDVIAYDGARLGGETFVSFDKQVVSLLAKQGRKAQLLQ